MFQAFDRNWSLLQRTKRISWRSVVDLRYFTWTDLQLVSVSQKGSIFSRSIYRSLHSYRRSSFTFLHTRNQLLLQTHEVTICDLGLDLSSVIYDMQLQRVQSLVIPSFFPIFSPGVSIDLAPFLRKRSGQQMMCVFCHWQVPGVPPAAPRHPLQIDVGHAKVCRDDWLTCVWVCLCVCVSTGLYWQLDGLFSSLLLTQ